MKNKQWLAVAMAGVMGATLLTGCGGSGSSSATSGATSEDASQGETIEITWMVRSDEPNNYDSVMAAVNEKLKEDLNMTLNMRFIAPGDYDTKMQMAMAGGDEWDLCFTSHWANNYVNAAGKGAYLELTEEMLQENAPNLMATIPEQFWDGIEVNNKVYALMNYQVMYDQPGFMILKDAVEEQNIDINSIDSWEKLDATLGQLAEAYPDKYATRGGDLTAAKFLRDEPISTIMSLPFLAYDPETKKISNTLYFDECQDYFRYAKEWKDKGYTPADAATMQDELTMLSQGQILSRYSRYKPGNDSSLKNTYGNDWLSFPMGKGVVDTNSAQSTLTAVNVNSEHPEEAIQLYDYIFGNQEVSNMLFFGLEGQDYELVNGRVKRNPDGWNFTSPWMIGNQFQAYLMESDEEGIWEKTMQGNEEAELDALFGFVPDRTPIETELATCEAVWTEYKDILNYGLDDYNTVIPQMMEKLKAAGLDTVTAELQSQLDEFLASKA